MYIKEHFMKTTFCLSFLILYYSFMYTMPGCGKVDKRHEGYPASQSSNPSLTNFSHFVSFLLFTSQNKIKFLGKKTFNCQALEQQCPFLG
jgi:hypothetical protein